MFRFVCVYYNEMYLTCFLLYFSLSAGLGHTALDVDQPLCDLGLAGLLRVLQLFLGRHNLVSE